MNAMCTTRCSLTSLLLAAALAGVAGCSMPKASDFKPSHIFSLESGWPWRDEDEPAEGTPVRMVCAWTDTVLTKPGQKPQRGFGGRLMFYDQKGDEPILVDGQLVVYAFAEEGREPTDNKPTRRYVFPADQLPLRMSQSEIGASYSFWLPWDEAPGPKTEVSLICRFEPEGGAVITSEQTRHLLPGPPELNSATANKEPPKLPEGVPSRPAQQTLETLRTAQRLDAGTKLASYESTAEAPTGAVANPANAVAGGSERQMTVTSITLPDGFRVPDGANVSPLPRPAVPVNQPLQPAQQAWPVPGQQPVPTTQLGPQPAQHPAANGSYAAPQLPPFQNSFTASAARLQPMSPVTTAPRIHAPVSNEFGAPMVSPPSMRAPQPAVPATGPTSIVPQHQAMPQMMPQQTLAPTPIQTTVSYGPPAMPAVPPVR